MPLPWAWWRLGGGGPKTVRDVPVVDVVGAGASTGRPVRAIEISDVVGGSAVAEALHRVVRHFEVSDVVGGAVDLDFVRRAVRQLIVADVVGTAADLDYVRRGTRHIEISDTSGVAGELDFVRRAIRDFPFMDVLGGGAAQRQVRRAVRDFLLQDVGNLAGAFVPRHRRGRVLRAVEVADVVGAGASRTTRPVGPPTVTYDPEYLQRGGTVTATLSYLGGIGGYLWQYGLRGRWFDFTTGNPFRLTYTLPSWVPNGWSIRFTWTRGGRRELGPELIVGAQPPVDLSASVDMTAAVRLHLGVVDLSASVDLVAADEFGPDVIPPVDLSGSVDLDTGGTLGAPPADVSGGVDMTADPAVPPVAVPPVDLSDSVDLVARDKILGIVPVDLSASVNLFAADRLDSVSSPPVDLSGSVNMQASDDFNAGRLVAPGNLAATFFSTVFGRTDLVYTLSWGAVTGATDYYLQLERRVSGAWQSYDEGRIGSAVLDVRYTLPLGTYRFRMAAVGSGSTGPYSGWLEFTVARAGPPAVPTNVALVVNAVGNNLYQPVLSWDASQGATSYEVHIQQDSTFNPGVWENPTPAMRTVASSPWNAGNWHPSVVSRVRVRVRAVNSQGSSAWSAWRVGAVG